MKYSVDSKLGDLLANAEIKSKLSQLAPKAMAHPYLQTAVSMGFTLKQCASMAPGELPRDVLQAIGEYLESVE